MPEKEMKIYNYTVIFKPLGISLWNLPELLSSYEIPWLTYNKRQMEADMEALCKCSVMNGSQLPVSAVEGAL